MTTGDVDWAAEALGSPVVAQRPLTGGWTSTILALDHADGQQCVLRVIDREPWATHRAALATRERDTQVFLVDTAVPAPRSLALDATSGRHLMTLVPGVADLTRTDDDSLAGLAATLAVIHDLRPADPPRTYQSWAFEAKYVVPGWATDPGAWHAAYDLLRLDPPAYEPTFLHRDFRHRNVLWQVGGVSAVVDWVETSSGPAWLDVAHCATSIALVAGLDRAEVFMASYTALTGRPREPFWELMDAVGLVPPPGLEARVTDPVEQRRLEEVVAAALGALNARRRP